MIEQFPRAVALADGLRDRIIEIELARGDVATHASNLALSLGSVDGAGTVTSLLSAASEEERWCAVDHGATPAARPCTAISSR